MDYVGVNHKQWEEEYKLDGSIKMKANSFRKGRWHRWRVVKAGKFIVKIYYGCCFRLRSESESFTLKWILNNKHMLPFQSPRPFLHYKTHTADLLIMEQLPIVPFRLGSCVDAEHLFSLAFSALTKFMLLGKTGSQCGFITKPKVGGLPFEVGNGCFDFLLRYIKNEEARNFFSYLWSEFGRELNWETCLSHGAMRVRHWLWNIRDQKPVLIDWETSHYFLCFADHAALLLDIFIKYPDLALIALKSLSDSLQESSSPMSYLLYKFSLLWLTLSYIENAEHYPPLSLHDLLSPTMKQFILELSPYDFSSYIWEHVFSRVTFALPKNY